MAPITLRACVFVLLAVVATSLPALLKPVRPTHAGSDRGFRLERVVPRSFGGWRIDASLRPIPLSPDAQATLQRTYTEVLERTYVDPEGRRVMLSLDYADQFEWNNGVHRPEICYPSQGFLIEGGSRAVMLQTPAGPVAATRLVARRGPRNEPITYWLVMGSAQMNFGMRMNWLQLRRGLTGTLPDGLLVRVSSIGNDEAEEFDTQARFIRDMISSLAPADRPHFVGSSTG